MKEIKGKLTSLHAGSREDYSKPERTSLEVDLEGFPEDKHRGFQREAQSWDSEPNGIARRNERQWSGVSLEELEIIREKMDLREELKAETLGANICVEGIPNFSRLPRGSKLIFPSGAVLVVEEDNPPCTWMAEQIAAKYMTNSDKPVPGRMFPKYAMGLRGVVGVVDVPGTINRGGPIVVKPYQPNSSQ